MSFFYNVFGDKMKIYLDLIFLINFAFDFLLLIVVDLILKRKSKIYRLLLGTSVGSLSIFFLFLSFNTFTLFLFKVFISIIMILIAFSFKNIKYFINNLLFLYTASILLGGFLYYLNTTFSYKQEGMVFFYDKMSINYIFLLIIAPIILYLYIKQNKSMKTKYNNYYDLNITFKDNKYINLRGILDTGNYLKDPITNKKVIIVNNNLIDNKYKKRLFYVPYRSLNHNSILSCISIKEVNIIGLGSSKNVLIGLSEKEIAIDGVDAILNNQILEEIK